ncbi:MAG: cyclic nucleotide-binding domain-containing protein [Alphaproteobacteria bacterium]|nr:cyclic nucleotide-binding domain-containing protein [Alphaproteobacteria bacterium]
MHFLERFDDDTRIRFEAASTLLHLEPGSWLVRRGEPGGDIYVLEDGTLEVVDVKPAGEAVLAVLQAGAVVGEVAYLDDAPRSADVRARVPSRVRRWAREDVQALLEQDHEVAVRFLEGLGRVVAARMRATNTSHTMVSGVPIHANTHTLEELLATADRIKDELTLADERLRAAPQDPDGSAQVRTSLDLLRQQVASFVAARPDREALGRAMQRLRRELRPWLNRSRLATHLVAGSDVDVITPALLGHVLEDAAAGEGPLGARIDRWLLNQPSQVARRDAERHLPDMLDGAAGPGKRVLLLDTPASPRLVPLRKAAEEGAMLVLVDPSHAVLTDARALLGPGAQVATVQENPARLALGQSKEDLPPVDVAHLGELLSYLPDRLAVPLLAYTRSLLRPGGLILLTALDHTDDEPMWDHLLRWPSIRRSAARLERLAARVGLGIVERPATRTPSTALALTVQAR